MMTVITDAATLKRVSAQKGALTCSYQRCAKPIESVPYVSKKTSTNSRRRWYHVKCAKRLNLL